MTTTAPPSPVDLIVAQGKVLMFGKHKGHRCGEVPLDYLVWCLGNLYRNSCRSEMETIIRAAGLSVPSPPPPGSSPFTGRANSRNGHTESPVPPTPGLGSARLIAACEVRALVKTWYGELARRYHPDRGGSAEQFAVANAAYQSLMTKLTEWEGKK